MLLALLYTGKVLCSIKEIWQLSTDGIMQLLPKGATISPEELYRVTSTEGIKAIVSGSYIYTSEKDAIEAAIDVYETELDDLRCKLIHLPGEASGDLE